MSQTLNGNIKNCYRKEKVKKIKKIKNKKNGTYNTFHGPLSLEWIDARY